jgi:ankyrin repeat protein
VDPLQSEIEECVGNAHGNLARVKELIGGNPSLVNARAPWNETPIEAATQMGDLPIIDYLIEQGAPVDLFTACVLGRAQHVRDELERDPSGALARGVHDLPALYFAAIGGHIDIAELLFASGARIDDRAEAAAPIHGAVMGGHPRIVAWLLEHGADPDVPDYKGRGAAQLAREMGREAMAVEIERRRAKK